MKEVKEVKLEELNMTRDEILAAARQCISVDRAATYGDAKTVYGLAAKMFEPVFGIPGIDAGDALVMMALMKIARAKSNPKHADSWVDAIGYLALAGEIATELSTQVDKV